MIEKKLKSKKKWSKTTPKRQKNSLKSIKILNYFKGKNSAKNLLNDNKKAKIAKTIGK